MKPTKPNRRSRGLPHARGASGNPEHNRDKRLSKAPRKNDSPRPRKSNSKPQAQRPRKSKRDDSPRPHKSNNKPQAQRPRKSKQGDSPRPYKSNSKPQAQRPHKSKRGDSPRPRKSDSKPHAQRPRQNDAPRKKRGIAISKWVSPALATPAAPAVSNTPSVTKIAKTPNTNAADKSEKVQKILAHCGLGARREMEVLIQQGKVTVNGQPIQLGARATAKDTIAIAGKPIARPRAQDRLLAYNKPKGKWVSREAGVDSVFDDLPELEQGRWLNIGRLDINTEGLLLFSTNGEWVQELAHPSNGYEREYHARVCGKLPAEEIRKLLTKGVFLAGEKRVLRPLAFELKSKHGEGINFWYRIVLSEGRNRAVRRIFEHYNLQISRLLRVRFGPYTLPKDLLPNHTQEISREKV